LKLPVAIATSTKFSSSALVVVVDDVVEVVEVEID
jgi:hypothetical protein